METIQISVLIIAGLLLVIFAFMANTKWAKKELSTLKLEPAHWIPFWMLWAIITFVLIGFIINNTPSTEDEIKYLVSWPLGIAVFAPSLSLLITCMIKAQLDEKAKKKAQLSIDTPIEDAIVLPPIEEHPVEKAKREALKAREELFKFRNGGKNG